jgi:uncharacterized protein (TIGR02452 family)
MEQTVNKLYTKIQDDNCIDELVKYPFSSKTWLKFYNKYQRENNDDGIRSLRKYIIRDTLRCIEPNTLTYKKGTTKRVLCTVDQLKESAVGTRMYSNSPAPYVRSVEHTTELTVVNRDCIEAAVELINLGYNPIVLNNASFKRPGGGYMEGAGAQEENIFRRSTYMHALADPHKFDTNRSFKYPIPEFGGIYSPNVVVFRSSEATGYDYLEHPISLSFVAVAAYVRPQLQLIDKKKKIYFMTDKFAEKIKEKIRVILRIALENNHDSIVLGAFGCGAFMNSPDHMSLLFDQVLFEEEEFIGSFKHICFAIIDDKRRKMHNPNGNYLPFAAVMKKRQLLLNSTDEEIEDEGDEHLI